MKEECVEASNFSQKLLKQSRYDTKGRLREKEITDNKIHTFDFEYDFNDHLIQKIDTFGNSTHYTYDAGKVTKTAFPPIASFEGGAISVEIFSIYDSLDREISRTDANGHVTHYRYNAYGSPTNLAFRWEQRNISLLHQRQAIPLY